MASAPQHSLLGKVVPSVSLPSSDGGHYDLSQMNGKTVLYVFPRTSPPNEAPIEGWDEIPGARGCTPQSCGFRDHHREIVEAGAARVFGLSTQDSSYHNEVIRRLRLPYEILSDANLNMSSALGLQTFKAGSMTLLCRITLIINDGFIEKVFDPVTDPGANAADVRDYLLGRLN
ncbi:peroxiredoxin [Phaeobacter inhibens]|uniref:peroxiredoxin n=1 Tax=Phaeobacter inhibens TaxID=221822 RepID=UPI00076BAF7D|nr:peroxiredoxin [Phaeobacter inhibens]KXF92293.1 hypothetical protein AT574_02640 [Phaeobacter inhibens]WHP68784.1 peroxiredoxin [Phaeobacter inhibens]